MPSIFELGEEARDRDGGELERCGWNVYHCGEVVEKTLKEQKKIFSVESLFLILRGIILEGLEYLDFPWAISQVC